MRLKTINSSFKQKCGIYKLSAGGHIYIGSSKNLYDRLREHRCDLRNKIHANKFLQNVYNKYGEDLEVEIVEYCSPEDRFDREKFWINYYQADMNLIDPITLKPISGEILQKLQKSISSASTKRLNKLYNDTKIECYDYFGDFICVYNNLNDAANDIGVSRKKLQEACGGYKKGITLRGKRFRYENSKVPIQKFDINEKYLGRYFDFNFIDEEGIEQFAFDSVKNVYTFLAKQLRKKNDKIIIIPRLRKYCEAWNTPKEGNHIPSPIESMGKDQRLEEVTETSGVVGETSTSAVQ